MTHTFFHGAPLSSRPLRPRRSKSHLASAAQLVTLVAATGIIIGCAAVAVFVAVVSQLALAGH